VRATGAEAHSASDSGEKRRRLAALLARIDARCAELRLSRRALCRAADLKDDCIRTIARGNEPKMATLTALARQLHVSVDYLTGAVNSSGPASFAEPEPNAYVPRRVASAATVPLGPYLAESSDMVAISPMPGGGWLGGHRREEATSERPILFSAALIERRLEGRPTDFWWAEITGKAMAPELDHGDKVLIDRRSTQPVQPGMFAVNEGIGSTARWVEYVPGSAPPLYRVRCSDTRFAPYDVPAAEMTILGRIVWLSRCL
jgi:hypothetical protein